MAETLKDRCSEFIAEQQLSKETARLFLDDAGDGALRASTVRRVISAMADKRKTPDWLKTLFAEAALRDRDSTLAQALLEQDIHRIDLNDLQNGLALLEKARLLSLLLQTAEEDAQSLLMPETPGVRSDLFAVDAAANLLVELRIFKDDLALRESPSANGAGEQNLKAAYAEIEAMLPGIAKRGMHPDQYGLTLDEAAEFLLAAMRLEDGLELCIPALDSLAEMLIENLEKAKAQKKRPCSFLVNTLKCYFPLKQRLARRIRRLYVPADQPFSDAFDERVERLAKRAAQFAKLDVTPEAILKEVVSLELSGDCYTAAALGASDIVQRLMLGETVPFAREEALEALAAKLNQKAQSGKKRRQSSALAELALLHILDLRRLFRLGGTKALLAHAEEALKHESLPHYEFALLHSLLVAAGVECAQKAYLDMALQLEARPEAESVAESAEGARYAFWQARRVFATPQESEREDYFLKMFAIRFSGTPDGTSADNYAANENRRMKALFGRRAPSPESEQRVMAMLSGFMPQQQAAFSEISCSANAMAKKAQKKIRTLALEFEARLKRFPPHERGLLWWSAATTVQSTLVFLTNKKRYPAEYFCRYIAVLAASTKVAFAVNDTARLFMKPVIEARLIFQKASEMSSSNGVDLPSLPWTQSFDLPWFPEVEKRLGRIVGRFNLFGGFSVIKVADARDPDLVHFVTTGMSAKFFGDTPAEDHEFFITITKKGSDSAKACPKVLKPAMIEYAPATELEYSAIQILYAVYHMYRSKLKSEFQRKFIMMYRAETDGAPAAERFTRSTKLAPIASDLPYKAVTTCDTDRDRRIAPFAYGDGRTMTLTACVPLYAEELQYAIDHSAQALFERFGLEAFTPMRQTRENLGAGIVES